MLRIFRFAWVLALLVVMSLVACGKTVEGEGKEWTQNTQRVSELAIKHPAYKAALEQRTAKAKAIFDSAQGLAHDDAAKKMASANTTLFAGFVEQLDKVEKRIKKINDLKMDAAKAAKELDDKVSGQTAIDIATKAVDKVEGILKETVADEAAATIKLDTINKELKSAEDALEKVIKSAKDKKSAKVTTPAPNAAPGASGSAGAAGATEAPKAAMWKCKYCSTLNKDDVNTCNHCGAPRTQ